MKTTCGLIVLRNDGTREYLRYDSYSAMKYEARSIQKKRNGMVVCWWSKMERVKEVD